jgi:hypothetical protein
MIRYRFPGLNIAGPEASACLHPTLARLRFAGPWRASRDAHGATILEQGTATEWSPEEEGLDGCLFSLAVGASAADMQPTPHEDAVWLTLANGRRWPILPLWRCPRSLGLDGTPRGWVGDYPQAAAKLWERMRATNVDWLDPDVLALVRLALASLCPRLTPELAHALGFITFPEGIPAIVEAVFDLGKVEAATPPSR